MAVLSDESRRRLLELHQEHERERAEARAAADKFALELVRVKERELLTVRQLEAGLGMPRQTVQDWLTRGRRLRS